MSETRFYELSNTTLEKSVPQLLYKIYDNTAKPILLLLDNQEEINKYDKLLWSFSSNKFLPHGTKEQGKESIKPLFLTNLEENLNEAEILVSTKKINSQDFETSFKQTIYIFNKELNTDFINLFRSHKEANLKTTYWQQDASGKWHDI